MRIAAAGREDSGPSLYNFQIADVAGESMNAVTSILAAIICRERTGQGKTITQMGSPVTRTVQSNWRQ